MTNYQALISKSPEELARIFEGMCENMDMCTDCPFRKNGIYTCAVKKHPEYGIVRTSWLEWMLSEQQEVIRGDK